MTRNSRRSTTDRRALADGTVVVLGLDPGTLVTGYGVVMRKGESMKMIACGTIRNDAACPLGLRLRHIYDELSAIIVAHHPAEFAIESAFYGKNAQSALKLGHARGVAMLAAAERDIPTAEYSPREVKKAVAGKGRASKEQVRYMVGSLLGLDGEPIRLDASDALAIAICHLHRLSNPSARHRTWRSYIAAHPERVAR